MTNTATPPEQPQAAPASPGLTQSKITPSLGDYRLISKIGQGGIAEIYKAIQTSLDREVAVKILSSKLSSDPDIVRRFDRESLTIARLNHPNIVHVIDRGFSQGRYYFVMEYVEGASFKEILTTADIPLRTRLEIIVMTLKGLDYAHKNGVVHRDIKPANILIDKHGNAKVADFGIAHIAETPDNEATRSDIVMGTMAYMSPEQKVSSANVDETTDIYAVGVMLYESLVGQKPLGKFKLPSELDPELSNGFDAIVEKALAPIKKDRYQTAVAMKDDLLDLVSAQRNGSAPKPMASVSGVDTIVGSCRYLDTIRENDYGATYLVENKKTKRLIVIKRFNKEGVALDEAKALTQFQHENLVKILGAGSGKQKTVIVMEYAPGGSLADRLVRTYNWEEAFAIGVQIVHGLGAAHKQNIVHGNLRPSNVLFDGDDTVKLSDFGSPQHYSARRNWYSPPEKGVSPRGDIYSLGVILHQMLYGQTPNFSRHGHLLIPERDIRIPDPVRHMLQRTLALKSTERYQSCDELLADWEEFTRAREASAAPVKAAPATSKARRQPSGMFMLTVGLLIGMALGIVISYLVGLPV